MEIVGRKIERKLDISTKTTKEGIIMIDAIEGGLYIDLQARIPAHYCPRCGGACYRPGLICLRCERDRA